MTRLTHEEVVRVAQAMSKKQMLEDDIRELALAAGVLLVAVPDVIMRFSNDGTESFSEFMDKVKSEAPHWFPPPELGDGIDPKIVEAACGARPTLSARAELYNVAGADLYKQLIEAWGGETNSLAPGQNPKHADAGEKSSTKKPASEEHKNPFDPLTKFGSDQVRQNECAKYIAAFGAKSAASAAAKYGTDIAGRPLRKKA
jgi:hypothetical protein